MTTSAEDLSDDIWIKIFQYTHHNILGDESVEDPTSICRLFTVVPYVSKHLHKICNSYAKIISFQVEHGTIGNLSSLPLIEWMCKCQVKICSFNATSYHDINSLWLRIIVHMLISCDTTDLKSFTLKCSFSLEGSDKLGTLQDAELAGISLESMHLSNFMDELEHQALLANTLGEQAPNLESLSLIVQDNIFHTLYLGKFQSSLKELELFAYEGEFDSFHYSEHHNVKDMIENMTSLTKLTLTGEFRGSMTINSESLQEINIRGMSKHSDFVVESCVCPKLKLFACAWDNEHSVIIGLEAVNPLDDFDLEFEDDVADIVVGTKAFHGLDVPKDCVVSLLRKRFLL